MPFAAIPAIVGAVGAGAGAISSIRSSSAARGAAQSQLDIERQQAQLMQEAFGLAKQRAEQLEPFIQQLSPGSDLFKAREAGMFGDISQDFSNRVAQVRQLLAPSASGYAPTGREAGLLGGAATDASRTLAQQRLQNWFNSVMGASQLREAQGRLVGTGGEFALRRFQNPQFPGAGGEGGAFTSLAQALQGLIGPGRGRIQGQLPLPTGRGGPDLSPQLPGGGPGTTPWNLGGPG